MQPKSSTRRFRNNIFVVLALLFSLLCLVPCLPFTGFLPAATTPQAVRVPIVMYHMILRDPARSGKYIIPPETLENDLKWISDNGYHTVTVRDLIAYVYRGTPLPENPILLSFDDGYTNNYTYAYPLLKQHRMRAVLSVVGSVSEQYTVSQDENPNYATLTWERIRELSQSGLFEIQNHTYDLHHTDGLRKGCTRLPGESVEEYQALLLQDLVKNQDAIENAVKSRPQAFVYPFGAISLESAETVKKAGFLSSFSCEEGINLLRMGDYESLYFLKRKNRPAGISSDDFFHNLLNE